MNVYEKAIASECPPANGEVLWINTARTPVTFNMNVGGSWQVLGAFTDARVMIKILETLGEISIPDHPEITTISDAIAFIFEVLDMPTEAETKAMFVLNN